MLEKFIFLLRKVNKYPKQWRDLYLVYTSGLFDGAWYLTNNPDVAQAKANPLLHYLHYGGFEGRDPGPSFSSRWYLDTYEDVKKARINPLVHYLKYGRKEGREARLDRIKFASPQQRYSLAENKVDNGLPFNSEKLKVFCIGHNKTGTTSIELALRDFGYKVGVQSDAERLLDDWVTRDFRRIIQYCSSADAFQDIPFSLDFTYQILDYAFPGSKFILTVRNNADEWYQSLVRFHSKLMGVNGTPTADDLKNFPYQSKGWLWRVQRYTFGVDESTLYDEKIYKSQYTNYNDRVVQYFQFRQKDLLVLNLSDPLAMQSLCEFLEIEYAGQIMPHANKSK